MKKLQIILILSVVAFLNAGYLTYKRYCINFLEPTKSFCDINATYSCSNVLSHPSAMVFGIPFPAIAMIVYPILFIIALLGYHNSISNYRTILSVLSGLGILFNGYFIYQETFIIQAFCPLCLLCTGIIITICILSLLGRRNQSLSY